MSDLKFAVSILNERMSGLNPYSPLSTKLRSAAATLGRLADTEETEKVQAPQTKQYSSYEDVFDKLEWRVYKCNDRTLELEKYSPGGEDFIFDIDGKDIAQEVAEYTRDFDVDEHVELWVGGRGKRGVPDTVRELVDDADAIKKMLVELAEALESVQTNCELGTYDCNTCVIHGNCDREEEGDEDDA